MKQEIRMKHNSRAKAKPRRRATVIDMVRWQRARYTNQPMRVETTSINLEIVCPSCLHMLDVLDCRDAIDYEINTTCAHCRRELIIPASIWKDMV